MSPTETKIANKTKRGKSSSGAENTPVSAPSLDAIDSLVRLPYWTKKSRGRCVSPQDIPCYFYGAGFCWAHHYCTGWVK